MTTDRIKGNQLADWWALIQEKGNEPFVHTLAPLMNLYGCEEKLFQYGRYLHILDVMDQEPEIGADGASFKRTTQETLLALRKNLALPHDVQTVLVWAEKLMRYCEIFYSSLKPRALEKWGTKDDARLGMLHLTVFLLDVYFAGGDFRYLNTVLKLLDFKWLYAPDTFPKDLARNDIHYTCALFQFRLSLMMWCAFERMGEGGE